MKTGIQDKQNKAVDQPLFYQFIQKNQKMVYNICLKMLNNRQDAEDIAQDVFVKAYENFNTFEGNAQISTWLYRIAVNLSLNFIKRKKRLNWLTLDFDSSTSGKIIEPPATEQPDIIFDQNELDQTLQQAIHKLPEKQKTAFILNKLEGLSHQKISEILNISISSVEARIHRAKQSLRRDLVALAKK